MSGVKAIAFTGMPGAGKSIAVEVAHKVGLPVFRMGDAVWAEVQARGLPLTNESVGKVATEMRQKHGPGIWAERTVERIRATGNAGRVIIDGVRNPEEVDAFRRVLGHDFLLVAIHAAPSTRLQRLMERNRPDDVQDERQFHGRDERELAWGIGKVIALADVMIVNEDGVEELQEKVSRLLGS
ncbi:MAG TPA: AAA family ATPase [Candidatus Thermoplasmatota archaeon]|nr:AAA family ATPase [Candidatus Thermoplasmatota archaeon]